MACKRIVVALDPSPNAAAAARVACELAAASHAALLGVAIVDEHAIERAEAPSPVGAEAFAWAARTYHLEHAQRIGNEVLATFAALARDHGLTASTALALRSPTEVLAEHGRACDLLVAATRTFFRFEVSKRPDHQAEHLLRHHSAPVLAVPTTGFRPRQAVVAYDGSVAATRAIRSFLALTEGQAGARDVTLLWAGHDATNGEQLLAGPRLLLEAHGRRVESRLLAGNPRDVLVSAAREAQPAWVVIGQGGGRSALRSWILGDVTHAFLADGTVPVLVG